MSTPIGRTRSSESGFALILALLALMLLTVLALTLATSTTSEVQIAANYRYGRQALYNAEAGLQVARHVLRAMNVAGTAQGTLPDPRAVTWLEGAPALPSPGPSDPEDYYPHAGTAASDPGCDLRGGVGYGRVLNDGLTIYKDMTGWNGLPLQGTFTIWVRRPLIVQASGQFTDVTDPGQVVVTVRGTAPFGGPGVTADQRSRQAERVLEQSLKLETGTTCVSTIDQTGRDQLGTGFDPCGELTGRDFAPGWLAVP